MENGGRVYRWRRPMQVGRSDEIQSEIVRPGRALSALTGPAPK
jgi:hypothetical protein